MTENPEAQHHEARDQRMATWLRQQAEQQAIRAAEWDDMRQVARRHEGRQQAADRLREMSKPQALRLRSVETQQRSPDPVEPGDLNEL
jgi:hypothetical protein